MPYLWGTIGLAVDVERVNADADDLKILWDPRYPGKITMLVGVRYRLGIALEYLGVSVNRTNPKELEEARQPLLRQKPLVAAYLH